MKKSLIALAVLSVSGVAMAQSSVTMYGVADASVIKLQGQRTQMGSGSGNTMTNFDSRLGVKGTEDMGGGLKAGFEFQTRLSLEDGSTLTKNASKGFWSPMAKVWVGGDSWGTFMMGRTPTPSYYGVATWEVTGSANYSMLGKSYGWGSGGSNRNDSQFGYKTPNIAGFTAELGYITKTDVQNSSTSLLNGGANGAKWDASVVYSNGPIAASLVANKVSKAVNLNGSKVNWVIGGKYDFGSFIVAASYNNTFNNNNNSGLAKSQLYAKRNGVTVGGTALFGPFSLTADIGRDTKLQDKNGNSIKKNTNFLLEAKYRLSKRTFIYLAGLRLDKTNNYGLGLQHSF